jgi:hypothetical protein
MKATCRYGQAALEQRLAIQQIPDLSQSTRLLSHFDCVSHEDANDGRPHRILTWVYHSKQIDTATGATAVNTYA